MCNPAVKTPLMDALERHQGRNPASLHTPGHKGTAPVLSRLGGMRYDLTELPDTGSLFDGGDCIEESEKLAAAAFGAGMTLYSGGGCTLCIQTMLLLARNLAGNRVLMGRNAHRSAVNAAALLGLEVEWLWPDGGLGSQPAVENIDEKLKTFPDIRVVYLTSPDYTGRMADIQGAAAVCRRHGALLLVDNAHGSHLGAFGRHPLALGADMSADSAHKTLPVLTGGAMLQLSEKLTGREVPSITRPSAKAAMALFASTSPPFPVLASLDLAQSWWSTGGREAYGETARQVAGLRLAAREAGISPLDGEGADPARLALDVTALGITGLQAAGRFREKGLEPEHADDRWVIGIVTPFLSRGQLARLEETIRELPGWAAGRETQGAAAGFDPFAAPRPVKRMEPRQAMLCRAEELPAAQAAGRVAARSVCPCPPGIAAVVPGEEISPALARLLPEWGYPAVQVVKE